MKNWKTTAVGVLTSIGIAIDAALPYLQGEGEVDVKQLIIAAIVAVGSTLMKDHDKDNNEEIVAAGPGGGGIKNPKPDED